MISDHPYAYFRRQRDQYGELRVVGIRCPQCSHSKSGPEHREAASAGQRVTCTKCGWTGRVPS